MDGDYPFQVQVSIFKKERAQIIQVVQDLQILIHQLLQNKLPSTTFTLGR